FPFEPACNPRWICPPPCRHRGDDDRLKVVVDFIWRDDQTRPGLLNLAADCRIEVDQVNVEAVYCHSHSSSSQLERLGSGASSNASSPRRAISRKAAAQPARGFLARRMTSVSPTARISTSPSNPDCSSSGFGMRTPFEFPIWTMRVFMAFP